jgi:glycosyltransferase involved in cell wall biosynthesis
MGDYPHVARLESVTVLLPVINETTSLRQTVEVIHREVQPELLREILIIVCERTTPEARAVIADLQRERAGQVVVLSQQLPFLGGALRDGFTAARGSHVLIMASDLETDPHLVPLLIAEGQKNPSGIVTASRWLRPGSFQGYSPLKLACNRVFQRCFAVLFGTPLSDLTYGFRLLPKALLQALRWEELRHPLLFEILVKPLRLGVPVVEVPANWRVREEGESQNSFLANFAYWRTGLKARLARKQNLYAKCRR